MQNSVKILKAGARMVFNLSIPTCNILKMVIGGFRLLAVDMVAINVHDSSRNVVLACLLGNKT